jgi:hypothetical protein
MLILVPNPDIDKCVEILSHEDAFFVAMAIFETASIIHEVHPDHQALRKHPTVIAWQGHEVAMIDYGLRLCDKLMTAPAAKERDARGILPPPKEELMFLRTALSRHLSLAMDGGAMLGYPAWTKNAIMNLSHLSYLVTVTPSAYRPYLNTSLELGIPLLISPEKFVEDEK